MVKALGLGSDGTPRLRVLSVAWVVFLLGATLSVGLVWNQHRVRLLHERTEASLLIADNAQALQSNVERGLSVTHALAALIRHGNGVIWDFDTLASQLLPSYPGASVLILAPDGIIRDVAPLAGNEKAIGLNLLEDPVMKREAIIARDSGKLVLAGPLNLVQGGTGVIGRLPVYLASDDGKPVFWGFTNVVMRFPDLLVGTRLPQLLDRGFDYELWRTHPDSGQKQVIAASSSAVLVDSADHVLDLPYGNWTLSVAPRRGWGGGLGLAVDAALGLLVSLLLAFLAKLLVESKLQQEHLEAQVAQRTGDILASRNQLAAMLEAIPDPMWELGLDGHCHGCHSWRIELLATFMVELIGHSVGEKFPPAAADTIMAALREASQDGSSHGKEIELSLGRNILWFELSVARKAREPGQEDRFIVLARDVTERKRTEDLARSNAEHYRLLSEKLPLPMLIHVDGVIQYINQEWVKLLKGQTAGEFAGTSIFDFIHPDYRRVASIRLQDVLRREQENSLELKLLARDGTETWIETTAIAIPFAGRQAIYVVAKNIDERKRAEALERRRLDDLSAMYLLSNAVGNAESIGRVYEEAMDSLIQTLKADRVSIQLFDPDGVMRFKAWRGLSDAYRKVAEGHLPWPRDARDWQPVLVAEVDLGPEWVRFGQAAGAEGIKATGVVPLVLQGRLLGQYTVYFDAPHGFAENDIRLAKTIAFHVAFAVERKIAEESLRQSKDTLQMTLRCAPDAVFICSPNGRMAYVNDLVVSMLGYSREELAGMTVFDLVPPNWRERYYQESRRIVSDGNRHVMEIRLVRKDGKVIPMELNSVLLPSGQVYGACRDISERKRMESDLRIAATAFESQEGLLITDADSKILRVNKAFTEITGYSEADAVGQTPRLLQSGRQQAPFYAAMWESIEANGVWRGEIWNRRKSGEEFPSWLTITAVRGSTGVITHYVGSHVDITERKVAEEKIEHLAFFDSLTELPNRRLQADRLQQAMAASARSKKHGALLFLDLDNFKTLNDTLGHDIGDLLLQQVAQRLLGGVRKGDTVARLGGDEFVVILEDLSENPEAAAAQAEAIGEKIRDTLAQSYTLAGQTHVSTPSIGITLFSDKGETIDELMKQADLALYQAKAAGRNTLRFFDPQMQAMVLARADLDADLREAVLGEQFILHYQPQVDATAGVIGAEALLRWRHPRRGLVLPAEFISRTEDTGLIVTLGHWVLKTALKQLATWAMRPETAQLVLAVNVSVRQFSSPDFVDEIVTLADQFGADCRKLKLELTESLLMEDADDVVAKMTALRAHGVSFSLDDFGTGYSSLAYLKRLPLAQLKIDQSFVRDVATNPGDAVIANAIIALANNMGMSVIAEGVETEESRHFLGSHGCQVYQGYLYSRPLPLDEFQRYLGQFNADTLATFSRQP